MPPKRESFGSSFAVIMAFASSAIGLGNIWRFPYMVGEYGGAAFIIIYVLCSLLVAIPIFLAESVIGRSAGAGATSAFDILAPGTKWRYVGILCILAPIIIVSYYSVVGGWAIDYLGQSIKGSFGDFSTFSSSVFTPVYYHTIFLALSVLIVARGVKGIEKFSSFTTPLLFFLIVVIVIYSVSLPGAKAGIEYLVKPDLSKINGSVVAYALGQSFYSMSLGVGTILMYSSYMKKSENMLSSGLWTAIFDTFFAVLAGFAIMPAVFASGLEPGAGPSLIFETLPFIFTSISESQPILGYIVPILFFLTIVFAALTSEISMVECLVGFLMEKKKMSRKKSCIVSFVACWLIGIVCSLSFGVLGGIQLRGKNIFSICDAFSSNFLMMIGALAFSLFVGWKMGKAKVKDEFTNNGTLKTNGRLFPVFYFMVRYIVPVAIIVIFITNLIG